MNGINPAPGNPGFSVRIFVSFGVFLSFLAASASGIVLYFRPEGGLAAWTAWNVLGVDKKGWEGIHIASIALFILFAAAHVHFNWKSLLGYIRRRTVDGKRRRKERIAAFMVVLCVLAGAVARRSPVWKLVELRTQIKNGAHLIRVRPPAPNAEEMAIGDLCALAGIPLEEALAKLGAAGYRGIDAKANLAALAKKTGTSPERLYALIIGGSNR